ncbi:MAG: LON peptidase substrate-binding domain-containing protein [Verrucomicrobiia bacterium]
MEVLPSRVGIMVLPGVVLFPHSLLPLRIFEPRYRAMLAEALGSHRMFAVGMPDPMVLGSRPRPRPVAGLGLIRACVENEDGTSNLLLQGVARVRFETFLRTTPLFEGRPERIPSSGELSAEGQALVRRMVGDLLAMAGSREGLPEGLDKLLEEMRDVDMLTDVIAGTFLHEPEVRQELLETADLEVRVAKLAEALRLEYPNLKSL